MTKERYYAVRVGNPRRDWPYFMVRDDSMVPALFESRADAEKAAPKQPRTRVVRVTIHDGVCKANDQHEASANSR